LDVTSLMCLEVSVTGCVACPKGYEIDFNYEVEENLYTGLDYCVSLEEMNYEELEFLETQPEYLWGFESREGDGEF